MPEAPPKRDDWTVRRVLEWTTGHLAKHGSDSPRLDAELLLAHARKCRRIELYTRFDEPLTGDERGAMRELVKQRADHVPVAYLVGHREFYGLDFRVTPAVLIPRPETETLVLETIERARDVESPRILDLGTGSGCIPVALAVNLPAAHVTAIELSEAALDVARGNAEAHRVAERIDLRQGDLCEPLHEGETFDFVVSNPPYVTEAEFEALAPDVRLHEPKSALVAGTDGLDVVRRLVPPAVNVLRPGGWLLIEVDPAQVEAVQALLADEGGFTAITSARDLSGDARVVIARRADHE